MLEVRYNKTTNKITGWCGDENQFGNLKDRGGEEITIIDMGVPPKPLDAFLYDPIGESLIDNPDFVEPEPPRDLAAEIDELKVKVKKLEEKE